MAITLRDVQRMKDQGERIAMVTAYDYASARIADRAGVHRCCWWAIRSAWSCTAIPPPCR